MKNKDIPILISMIVLMGLSGVISACSSPTPTPTVPPPTATVESRITPLPAPTATSAVPTADGATLVETQCGRCHLLSRTTSSQKTRDQWTQTVNRMVRLSVADQATLLDYLTKTYSP